MNHRDEVQHLVSERDELARRCSQLDQRHHQFQHEIRRKEVEFEKLQGKLKNILTENKRRENRASLEIANLHKQRNGSLRRTASTRVEQEEVQKRVVEAYEAKRDELEEENAALRRALTEIQKEHKNLMNQMRQAEGHQQEGGSVAVVDPIEDGRDTVGFQTSHGHGPGHKIMARRVLVSSSPGLQDHGQQDQEGGRSA